MPIIHRTEVLRPRAIATNHHDSSGNRVWEFGEFGDWRFSRAPAASRAVDNSVDKVDKWSLGSLGRVKLLRNLAPLKQI